MSDVIDMIASHALTAELGITLDDLKVIKDGDVGRALDLATVGEALSPTEKDMVKQLAAKFMSEISGSVDQGAPAIEGLAPVASRSTSHALPRVIRLRGDS